MSDEKGNEKDLEKDSGVSSGATASTGRGRGRGRGRSSAASSTTTASTASTPLPKDEKPKNIDDVNSNEPDQLVNRAMKQFGTMDLGVMTRPATTGRGTLGRKIMLDANYFRLKIGRTSNSALVVQRYQVELVDGRRKLHKEEYRLLFWKLVENYPDVFTNHFELLYDDSKCCYSLSQLNFNGAGERVFELQCALPDDNRRMQTYDMRFQYTGPHNVDVRESYRGNDRTMSPVQIIDLILSQNIRYALNPALSNRWYTHGKSVFTRPLEGHQQGQSVVNLTMGREMWVGFHSAAKMSESEEPLINVDVSHTAFYAQCSVIQFLCHILNEHRDGDRAQYTPNQMNENVVWDANWTTRLTRELKGLKLRTKYSEKMIHKFFKIGRLPAQEMFATRDQGEISVLDYFNAKFPGLIKLPNLPCVCCGTARKNCMIPMELVLLDDNPQKTPHQRVSGEQTARLIRNSANPPALRRAKIVELLRAAQETGEVDKFKETFGVTLSTEPLQLEGRVLPTPNLLHNGGQRKTMPNNGEWKMDRGCQFYVPIQIDEWGAIAYRMHKSKNDACQEFCALLPQWMAHFGAQMKPCSHMAAAEDSAALIAQMYQWGKDHPNCKFVLVIFPNRDPVAYNNMKRAGEIELGIITQGILVSNVEKAIRSGQRPNATSENICLKVNMKNGGINNGIEVDEIFQKITQDPNEPTLFLGVDVTHPGPNDRGPSIAAIVANTDEGGSRWTASVKVQRHRREHVIYMRDQITERLMSFFKCTKKRPTRLVVFRDGVSEGEFEKVLHEEVASVRDAINSLNHKAKITYIVVQKRHHTRFFPTNANDGVGRMGNVPPGTVVDKEIISPDRFDFYLCSHNGLQGTSRPAHYCVLHDENQFTADEIQMLAFKLCHTYGRCNKSVSIPAPVYLADKACTRARVHYDAAFGSTSTGTDRSLAAGGAGTRGNETSQRSDEDLQRAVEVLQGIKRMTYFA